MPSTDLAPKIFRWYSYKEKDGDSDSEAPLMGDGVPFWRKEHKGRKIILIHAGIFCVYLLITTFIVSWVVRREPFCPCNGLIDSPARAAVRYERVGFDHSLNDTNVFKGKPQKELDDAWDGLVKYMNIRVQDEDLININRTSVPLNDEKGGYLATIDVFHEIHCLNVLRKQIYREYYPTKGTMRDQLEHADHCIDLLREVLMCHGDIAVQTFDWIDDYRWPWPNFKVDHECRSWDAIMDWAEKNYVKHLRGPIVTHPTLGISWREGGDDED